MTGSLIYAPNAWDYWSNPKGIRANRIEKTFEIKRWKQGDPIPQFGDALGIDTETELITDTCQVPPLVVTGVYNPIDNTCYIIGYKDTPAFMAEILKRHSMIYFANAGFDYYELWSQGLVQAASDRRIIDMLIRAPLKEIATIGYIRSYSLKDACKWHLLYEMDKHEEEGEASVRLNFRQNKEISDEEAHYLALDCVTTYLIGEVIGKQATEDTHTLGSIVLTHVRNNGMNVDEQMFSYCEGLLKKDMETYRQQLIQFGFPDPLKKKQKTEMEILQEGWREFITNYFQNFYDERYNIPFSIPCKNTCKRLILYGLNGIQNQQDRAALARLLTALLVDQKSSLNKAEKEAWDSLTDEWDFLTPCDTSRKKEVWPILLKCFFDGFLKGLSYDELQEAFDECIQDHSAWFAEEPEMKPTESTLRGINVSFIEHVIGSFVV